MRQIQNTNNRQCNYVNIMIPNSMQLYIFKLFKSKFGLQITYKRLFETTGLQINQQTMNVRDFCLNPNKKETINYIKSLISYSMILIIGLSVCFIYTVS